MRSRVVPTVLGLLAALPAARAVAAPSEAEAACGPALALATRLLREDGAGPAVELPRSRRGWLALEGVLERCSDRFPDDPRASRAALALAHLTAELHRRSHLPADYELAALRYAAVTARWPARPEARRAQLGLADLRLEFGSMAAARAIYRHLAASPDAGGPDAVSRRAARALAILRGLPAEAGDAREAEAEPDPVPDTAVAAPASFPAGLPAAPSHVVSITVERAATMGKIVIATDRPTSYGYGEIPLKDGLPPRVYVDVPGATLLPAVARALSFPRGRLLRGVRAAQNRTDLARVVADLSEEAHAHVYALERPPRIVIEVREATEVTAPKELKPPAGLTLSEAAAMPIRRVVVDAGHGGIERGAVGPTGLEEKEVTLDVARRLVPLLQRQGLEVILTRDEDRTVPLEARTRRANETRADLFISIHANAALDRRRDGVETYYLDLNDDAYTRRLAQRENQVSGRSMADLQLVAADIMTRAHTEDSMLLAQSIEKTVQQTLGKTSGGVQGVRKALFFVLVGAKMPSVLCELSFISNPRAEREMREPRFRIRAAEGIARGVAAFIAARHKRIAGDGRRASDTPAASLKP